MAAKAPDVESDEDEMLSSQGQVITAIEELITAIAMARAEMRRAERSLRGALHSIRAGGGHRVLDRAETAGGEAAGISGRSRRGAPNSPHGAPESVYSRAGGRTLHLGDGSSMGHLEAVGLSLCQRGRRSTRFPAGGRSGVQHRRHLSDGARPQSASQRVGSRLGLGRGGPIRCCYEDRIRSNRNGRWSGSRGTTPFAGALRTPHTAGRIRQWSPRWTNHE